MKKTLLFTFVALAGLTLFAQAASAAARTRPIVIVPAPPTDPQPVQSPQ